MCSRKTLATVSLWAPPKSKLNCVALIIKTKVWWRVFLIKLQNILMVNAFRYSSKALRERYSQARNDLASSWVLAIRVCHKRPAHADSLWTALQWQISKEKAIKGWFGKYQIELFEQTLEKNFSLCKHCQSVQHTYLQISDF